MSIFKVFPVRELQHGWHLGGEKPATDGTEQGQKVPGMKHGCQPVTHQVNKGNQNERCC